MYQYFCETLRTIDGDTIQARIDLGMSTYRIEKIRFHNIDAPEMNTLSGQLSRLWVGQNLWNGRKLKINSHRLDKYGRWLCDIHIDPTTTPLWQPGHNDLTPIPYSQQSDTPDHYTTDFLAQMLIHKHALPSNE